MNFGGFIITTFTIIPPSYFLQQIIPRMITTIERILIIQAVGRQIAITQPAPNSNPQKIPAAHLFHNSKHLSLLHLLHTMKKISNRYSELKELFLYQQKF